MINQIIVIKVKPRIILMAIDKYRPVHETSRANHPLANRSNMYVLQSGPHKGKMMGANQVSYHDVEGTDQRYIACEAPFDAADYYRMVLATDARTLVSLTRVKDSVSHRAKYPVDLHHIQVGQKIAFDGTGLFGRKDPKQVKCIEEKLYQASYADTNPLRVRTYEVNAPGKNPYKVKHIFYDHWTDHGKPGKTRDPMAIIAAINGAQAKFGSNAARHPVVVNCSFGQGRTNALIMMHQMHSVMQRGLNELIPETATPEMKLMAMVILGEKLHEAPYKVNVAKFIEASEARVIPFEKIQPVLLHAFPKQCMDAEIGRFALASGLNPLNPAAPANGQHVAAHAAGMMYAKPKLER